MLTPRVPLVLVDAVIVSSYGKVGGSTAVTIPRTDLQLLSSRSSGRLTPDAAVALVLLNRAVLDAGGDLRITDCFRSVAEQTTARTRYERWLAAGSPRPGTAGFNATTMKADFVAKPGRSNHNAGRAIDIHVSALRFPGLPADKQLDRMWEIARPLGWRPIIKAPTEGATESWHFDFAGPWASVAARLGYEQAAIAATLDVGQDEAFPTDGVQRRIQGGLHRAGYDIGDIDGILGKRTGAALNKAGWIGGVPSGGTPLFPVMAYVDKLPDSAAVLFRA